MDLREIPAGEFQRHPWDLSRHQFFEDVLSEHGVLPHVRRVFDVGASDGWFSAQLLKAMPPGAHVTCMDAFYTPEQLARFNAQGTAQTFITSWPDGPFELALLLDVLEHVQDDAELLGRVVATIVPGGWVLISVPAWQGLYTSHDTNLRHFRRYSPGQGERVIRGAGLKIQAQGGLFHSLLAVRGLEWAREKLSPPANGTPIENLGAWRHGSLLTRAVSGALALDNRLSHLLSRRDLDLPGLSWWALCRKPGEAQGATITST